MHMNLPVSLHMTPPVRRVLIGAGAVIICAALVLVIVTWLHRAHRVEEA